MPAITPVKGLGLHVLWAVVTFVDPRSAEQGGLGEGYGQNTMPSSVYNMFKEGDTRREGTVIVYADEAKKVAEMVAKGELPAGSAFQVSDQQENYEGLGHYKIHPRKETTSTVNPTDNYYNSWRIYRYADVLLLAVELDVRINGTGQCRCARLVRPGQRPRFQRQRASYQLGGKEQAGVVGYSF